MLNVSNAFLPAIMTQSNKIVGKVVIDYSSTIEDQSVFITVNEQANISWPSQVADGKNNPRAKYAALDGSWILDGSFSLCPDTTLEAMNYQMGWWGVSVSDSNGNYSAPYPTMIVAFTPRQISQITVFGDSVRNEFPVNFIITLYDSKSNVLATYNITGNQGVNYNTTITPVLNVANMSLQITKWNLPGRQVKIVQFYSSIQEVYLSSDIMEIHLQEEREISTGSLPLGCITANELDIKLDNSSRKFDAGNIYSELYGLVKQNRKIQAFLGVVEAGGIIEYVSLGVFWSGDWDAPETDIYAETTALDRLEALRTATYTQNQVFINQQITQNNNFNTQANWAAGTLSNLQATSGGLIMGVSR